MLLYYVPRAAFRFIIPLEQRSDYPRVFRVLFFQLHIPAGIPVKSPLRTKMDLLDSVGLECLDGILQSAFERSAHLI